MLSYKARRAGKEVVRVNTIETSKGLSYDDSHRGYISAFRIKMWGWDDSKTPVERRPLLVRIPASFFIETGSPLRK